MWYTHTYVLQTPLWSKLATNVALRPFKLKLDMLVDYKLQKPAENFICFFHINLFLPSNIAAETYSAGWRGTPGPSRSGRDSPCSYPPPPAPCSFFSRPRRSSFLHSELPTYRTYFFLFQQSPFALKFFLNLEDTKQDLIKAWVDSRIAFS